MQNDKDSNPSTTSSDYIKTKKGINVAIAEAQAMSQSVLDYDPLSNGALDYGNLLNELLKKISDGEEI